jgi:hypothetical protein
MLSVAKYSQDHIDRCRSQIDADIAAYADLGSTVSALESVFFNNMVLALDHYFLHRARNLEGYDVGDEINVGEEEFRRLAEGFLAEIATRYR